MLVTFIALGFNIGMFMLAKTYAKREDVSAIDARVTTMETAFKSMPTQQNLHQLELKITELHGDMKALRPEIRQLNRLHDAIVSVGSKDK